MMIASRFTKPPKKFRPSQLWDAKDLDRFASALVPILKGRGKVYECGRLSNRWAVVWVDLGRICRLVASQWAYPGLWRIHTNLPQPGDLDMTRRLVGRLGLNTLRLPHSPRPSEVTCSGVELADLAGLALQLAQGEEAYCPSLPWPVLPGFLWTPAAEEALLSAEWAHHREHWVKRQATAPAKVVAS